MLKLKRQQYSPSKMARAIQCVRDGMPKKAAAKLCGVPRTTLLDKLYGRAPIEHTKPGKKTVLTSAEEGVLVNYINLMAEIGYPVSRCELKREVKKILDKDGRNNPFKNNLPGDDWYDGFCRRHHEIKERKPQALGREMAIITCEMIECWFTTLNRHLIAEVPGWEEMVRDPRRTFNADESGFPLCATTGRVLAHVGAKHVYQVVSNNKQQITVMACFNANGDYMPPLIIFPGQRLRDIGMREYPEAIYGVSNKGWMDTELFVHFLKEFVNFVEGNCIRFPVILFVDGHSTHVSLAAAEFCREKQVVLYCLLPNATHVLQAADIGLFGPLKTAWRHELKLWYMENMGEIVTKSIFPGLFKRSWEKVTTGFKRAGLFPLSPENIDKSKLGPSKLLSPPKTQETQNVAPSASDVLLDNPGSCLSPNSPIATCTSAKSSSSVTLSSVTGSTDISSVHRNPGSTCVISCQSSTNAESENVCSLPPVTLESISVSPSSILEERSGDSGSVSNNISQSRQTTSIPSVTPSPSVTLVRSVFSETVMQNDLTLPPLQAPKSQNYVSPAFSAIHIPEIKVKTQKKTLLNKIPKALTGSKAIQMLREREETKKMEAKIKEERIVEKKRKQIQRELLKIKKKEERDRKRAEREVLKANKLSTKKRNKRKRACLSDSSSEDENVKITFADSDLDLDELEYVNVVSCFTCESACDDMYDWVQCVMCDRRLHVKCSDNLVLQSLTKEELNEQEFFCDDCVFE